MKRERVAMRGYSLVEILVVVAIIGVMSLVTVPQFIAYRQTAALKGALRNFNADLRNARQLAIARYVQVRMEFPDDKNYAFYYRSGPTDTWHTMPQELLMALRISGVYQNRKKLNDPMTYITNTFTDLNGNSQPDIIFNTDGSVQLNADNTQSTGSITIKSPWSNTSFNRITVTLNTTGKITTNQWKQ